jgi:hypothetical protein
MWCLVDADASLHVCICADYGTFRLYASDVQTVGLVDRLVLYFKDTFTTQVTPARMQGTPAPARPCPRSALPPLGPVSARIAGCALRCL